jgi:Ca2+-binding EF-hand superfamily protein
VILIQACLYSSKEDTKKSLNVLDTHLVCFRVYDLNGDRYISKEEMFQMLKNSLVKEAVEEDEDGVKDLVDLVLKKLDEDRDGRVSEADWSSAIAKEQLLMEAFGRCLPPKKVPFIDPGCRSVHESFP